MTTRPMSISPTSTTSPPASRAKINGKIKKKKRRNRSGEPDLPPDTRRVDRYTTRYGRRHERPHLAAVLGDGSAGNRTDRRAEDDIAQIVTIVVQPRGRHVRRDCVPERRLLPPEM